MQNAIRFQLPTENWMINSIECFFQIYKDHTRQILCTHPIVPVISAFNQACNRGTQFSKTRLVGNDETSIIQKPVQLVENKLLEEPRDSRQHRFWPILRLFGFVTIFENW